MSGALAGLRVVEIGGEISGPYATKILLDLGADVRKVEPPGGDPLRGWGPFPDGVPDRDRSGLFHYLNVGKHCFTADHTQPDDVATVRDLIADADLLVDSVPPGSDIRRELGLDRHTLTEINPGLVVVRISDFGHRSPAPERPTTPLTLQAAAGWVAPRQDGRPPVQAGARIPEYVVGAYAALGGLTALRLGAGGPQTLVEVDVSALECLLSTLPYPMLMAERLKSLGLPPNSKAAPMLGIVRAADGWIGINCLTGQHWLDVCAMIGVPEFEEHQLAIMLGGPERDQFFAKAQPWLDGQTVGDIVELSQAMRIPAAPVTDGASILDCPQYAERGFFTADSEMPFLRPGAAFRLSMDPVTIAPSGMNSVVEQQDRVQPFEGLKILDLSTFWAGAYLTCYLGAFGADVVKVESIQRPDGFRYSGAVFHEGDDWYERGPLWQATNLNKRDLTLDLNSADGRRIALQLAAEADVVVENFSPRVVEQFGMDYASLRQINPDVIMVRMPGFGLAGPWRDYVGWALNIEQLAGMSAATGYADGPPCNLQGPADPIAGVHAGVALLAALEHRCRTGEGQLVEVAQIEVGAAVTAEPVIEYSMTGTIRAREGNRHRQWVQGVYPARGVEEWVALSVRDDADWAALVAVLGREATRRDPRFLTPASRLAHHDEFDALVTAWTSTCTADEIAGMLSARGVPAARVLTGDRMYEVPELDAREYYQEMVHPLTGNHRYPGWPFRISPGPTSHHRAVSPTLGQHNREVLRDVGLSDQEIVRLQDERVIGTRIVNG